MPQKITNADAEGILYSLINNGLKIQASHFDELVAGGGKTIHPDDLQPMVNSWKHLSPQDDFLT
jgi:hypothetical protein